MEANYDACQRFDPWKGFLDPSMDRSEGLFCVTPMARATFSHYLMLLLRFLSCKECTWRWVGALVRGARKCSCFTHVKFPFASMLQMMMRSGKLLPALAGSAGDAFECIPDPVLLLIFNKLADVRAIGRCRTVSKRFSDLASKVDNALVRVDCLLPDNETRMHVKGKGWLRNLFSFLFRCFMRPFLALHQLLISRNSIAGKVPIKVLDRSPADILKNFRELQHLKIELPGAELDFEDEVLLKWKAEFGSTLESCVILGASSYDVVNSDELKEQNKAKSLTRSSQHRAARIAEGQGSEENPQGSSSHETEPPILDDDNATIPESFYTDGGLKLRVVWTITSLIAASARHYLLQRIILDHPILESLVLTDAVGQGTLSMSKQQLQDFRDKPLVPSALANRTQIPGLNMKLWYAPCLELPGGTCFKGATLLAIKPRDDAACKGSESFLAGAFEEPYRTATRMLAKRRTYILEMNPF